MSPDYWAGYRDSAGVTLSAWRDWVRDRNGQQTLDCPGGCRSSLRQKSTGWGRFRRTRYRLAES